MNRQPVKSGETRVKNRVKRKIWGGFLGETRFERVHLRVCNTNLSFRTFLMSKQVCFRPTFCSKWPQQNLGPVHGWRNPFFNGVLQGKGKQVSEIITHLCFQVKGRNLGSFLRKQVLQRRLREVFHGWRGGRVGGDWMLSNVKKFHWRGMHFAA